MSSILPLPQEFVVPGSIERSREARAAWLTGVDEILLEFALATRDEFGSSSPVAVLRDVFMESVAESFRLAGKSSPMFYSAVVARRCSDSRSFATEFRSLQGWLASWIVRTGRALELYTVETVLAIARRAIDEVIPAEGNDDAPA